jgi:hypothetical protein
MALASAVGNFSQCCAHMPFFGRVTVLSSCLAGLLAAPCWSTEAAPALAPDVQAAFDQLAALSPSRQADVLAQMERSRDAAELTASHAPLLEALIARSRWTEKHRRHVALVLAMLGRDTAPILDRLTFAREEAVREMAHDAGEFQRVIERTESAKTDERLRAIAELTAFGLANDITAEFVLDRLLDAYTRPGESSADVRVAAWRGLARFGERAAPRFVESLANPDTFFLGYSAAALKHLGNDAREALLAGLQHRDPRVRQRSVLILIEIGLDNETAAAIHPLEQDRNELVRKAALKAAAVARR